MTILRVPSFFFTNRIGLPKGEVEGLIRPLLSKSCICRCTSSFSAESVDLLENSQSFIVYIFYGVKKVNYGVRKVGNELRPKSPVALISDDLLGEIAAWRICKGSILKREVLHCFNFFDREYGRKYGPGQRSGNFDLS